jgi:hypothetical protein
MSAISFCQLAWGRDAIVTGHEASIHPLGHLKLHHLQPPFSDGDVEGVEPLGVTDSIYVGTVFNCSRQ